MSELKASQQKNKNQSSLPMPHRRALVSKLAKASVVVPAVTLLYDASNKAFGGVVVPGTPG